VADAMIEALESNMSLHSTPEQMSFLAKRPVAKYTGN